MTGLRDRPDVPKKGWRFVDMADLGAPDFTCEWCGTQPIRYVHFMTHPEWRVVHVGCVCAELMGDADAATRDREYRRNPDEWHQLFAVQSQPANATLTPHERKFLSWVPWQYYGAGLVLLVLMVVGLVVAVHLRP